MLCGAAWKPPCPAAVLWNMSTKASCSLPESILATASVLKVSKVLWECSVSFLAVYW